MSYSKVCRGFIQSYWRFIANHFVLVTSPLRLTTSNFIFQLNNCGYSLYVTSSLTRGLVCRLHLLLVLATAVILRSESRWTHDHILLSQIRDFPNLEGQLLVFISSSNRVAGLYPQTQGTNASFNIVSNSLVIDHPTNRHDVFPANVVPLPNRTETSRGPILAACLCERNSS
jgi:hypothetical protein